VVSQGLKAGASVTSELWSKPVKCPECPEEFC
jgi:hypothetical protein